MDRHSSLSLAVITAICLVAGAANRRAVVGQHRHISTTPDFDSLSAHLRDATRTHCEIVMICPVKRTQLDRRTAYMLVITESQGIWAFYRLRQVSI